MAFTPSFSRLIRDDGQVEAGLRSVLSRACEFKALAGDGVGEDAGVAQDEARDAIAEATRFIAPVDTKLAAPPP